MKMYWWLFWLFPIVLIVFAAYVQTRQKRKGWPLWIALSALFTAVFSPLLGVYGLMELSQLQLRSEDDLSFEGTGFWLAVLGLNACLAWLITDGKWKNVPAWCGFGSADFNRLELNFSDDLGVLKLAPPT